MVGPTFLRTFKSWISKRMAWIQLVVPLVAVVAALIGLIGTVPPIYKDRQSYLPSYYLVQRINRKIEVDLQKYSFIPHQDLVADIRQAAHDRGVFLLWAASNSGKSTHLHMVAKELQSNYSEGIDVIIIEPVVGQDITSWFRMGLDIGTYSKNIAELLHPQRKLFIILDQLDQAFTELGPQLKTMENFIIQLATRSKLHGRYSVLCALRDSRLTKDMLRWNGGTKIKLLDQDPLKYRWTDKMIEQFVTFLNFTDKAKEKALELALEARSVGFLVDYLNPANLYTEQAAEMASEYAKQWLLGNEILTSRPQHMIGY